MRSNAGFRLFANSFELYIFCLFSTPLHQRLWTLVCLRQCDTAATGVLVYASVRQLTSVWVYIFYGDLQAENAAWKYEYRCPLTHDSFQVEIGKSVTNCLISFVCHAYLLTGLNDISERVNYASLFPSISNAV